MGNIHTVGPNEALIVSGTFCIATAFLTRLFRRQKSTKIKAVVYIALIFHCGTSH